MPRDATGCLLLPRTLGGNSRIKAYDISVKMGMAWGLLSVAANPHPTYHDA
jgi:hypothetical protein